MASEKKAKKECYAAVVAKNGKSTPGVYKGGSNIHAEINALETYLGAGGTLANITRIELSSMPCKYCHVILKDLGLIKKVWAPDDEREYGSCSGGSYGWFVREGYVWNAIKNKTGIADLDEYCDSVIKEKNEL